MSYPYLGIFPDVSLRQIPTFLACLGGSEEEAELHRLPVSNYMSKNRAFTRTVAIGRILYQGIYA